MNRIVSAFGVAMMNKFANKIQIYASDEDLKLWKRLKISAVEANTSGSKLVFDIIRKHLLESEGDTFRKIEIEIDGEKYRGFVKKEGE